MAVEWLIGWFVCRRVGEWMRLLISHSLSTFAWSIILKLPYFIWLIVNTRANALDNKITSCIQNKLYLMIWSISRCLIPNADKGFAIYKYIIKTPTITISWTKTSTILIFLLPHTLDGNNVVNRSWRLKSDNQLYIKRETHGHNMFVWPGTPESHLYQSGHALSGIRH